MAKMQKRPLSAGCAFEEVSDMGKVKSCRSVIPINSYDERTGKEEQWWELRCIEHLDGEPEIELHECTFMAPLAEDDS